MYSYVLGLFAGLLGTGNFFNFGIKKSTAPAAVTAKAVPVKTVPVKVIQVKTAKVAPAKTGSFSLKAPVIAPVKK